MRLKFIITILCSFTVLLSCAQIESDHELIHVNKDIYMIQGPGGNIGVFVGNDGVFMIDDQFEKGINDVIGLIKTISDQPIKIAVNTHHHGDHTGGNSTIAKGGTTIYSHKNVRKRLKEGKNGSDQNSLPVVTFSDEINFHFNKEEIITFHVHDAHTDGDAIVYFTESNVIHAGDTFFNGKYPYIDLKNGGSVQGAMDALSKVIMLSDEETKIIPGHGPLATVKDAQACLDMLQLLTSKVKALINRGLSEDEIATNKDITFDFDQKDYGKDWFISNEKMLKTIYRSLQNASSK